MPRADPGAHFELSRPASPSQDSRYGESLVRLPAASDQRHSQIDSLSTSLLADHGEDVESQRRSKREATPSLVVQVHPCDFLWGNVQPVRVTVDGHRLRGNSLGDWLHQLKLWQQCPLLEAELNRRRAARYDRGPMPCGKGAKGLTWSRWLRLELFVRGSILLIFTLSVEWVWTLTRWQTHPATDAAAFLRKVLGSILVASSMASITTAGIDLPTWPIVLLDAHAAGVLDTGGELHEKMELTEEESTRFREAVEAVARSVTAPSAAARWLWHPLRRIAFCLTRLSFLYVGVILLMLGLSGSIVGTEEVYQRGASCACVYSVPGVSRYVDVFANATVQCGCNYTIDTSVSARPTSSSAQDDRERCCAACEQDRTCAASTYYDESPPAGNLTNRTSDHNCWLHSEAESLVTTSGATTCRPSVSPALVQSGFLQDALSSSSLWWRFSSVVLPVLKTFVVSLSGFGGWLAFKAAYDPRGAATEHGAMEAQLALEDAKRRSNLLSSQSVPDKGGRSPPSDKRSGGIMDGDGAFDIDSPVEPEPEPGELGGSTPFVLSSPTTELLIDGRPIEFVLGDRPQNAEEFRFRGSVVAAQPTHVDAELSNPAELSNAVAFVHRGQCQYLEKANHVAAAGAVALIVVNTEDKLEVPTLDERAPIPVSQHRHKISLFEPAGSDWFCDICSGRTSTRYRCVAGCDWDMCDECWDTCSRKKRQVADTQQAPIPVLMIRKSAGASLSSSVEVTLTLKSGAAVAQQAVLQETASRSVVQASAARIAADGCTSPGDLFDAFDADADGKLSQVEFEAFLRGIQYHRRRMTPHALWLDESQTLGCAPEEGISRDAFVDKLYGDFRKGKLHRDVASIADLASKSVDQAWPNIEAVPCRCTRCRHRIEYETTCAASGISPIEGICWRRRSGAPGYLCDKEYQKLPSDEREEYALQDQKHFDRVDLAKWDAILTFGRNGASWEQARDALGLTVEQALWASDIKLVFWHWSQPIAYLVVCFLYFCQFGETQRRLAAVIAVREIIYWLLTMVAYGRVPLIPSLFSSCCGSCATPSGLCPAFLLVEIGSIREEQANLRTIESWKALGRWVIYIFAPHYYVTWCLMARAEARAWATILGAFGCFEIVADCCGVVALHELLQLADFPFAMAFGYWLTVGGFVVGFGSVWVATTLAFVGLSISIVVGLLAILWKMMCGTKSGDLAESEVPEIEDDDDPAALILSALTFDLPQGWHYAALKCILWLSCLAIWLSAIAVCGAIALWFGWALLCGVYMLMLGPLWIPSVDPSKSFFDFTFS